MNKKNEGITLIALVITIIIMLILVAVTVSIAVNGGLFDYAKSAASGYDISKIQEELQTEIYGVQIEYYQKGETGSLRDFIFNDAEGKGQELLTTKLGAINLNFDEENNQITYKGVTFNVSEKGGVTVAEGATVENGNGGSQNGSSITPTISPVKTSYSKGDLVTLGTGANAEDFFVIEDSDSNSSILKLLPKYCIETTNYTQVATDCNVFEKEYGDSLSTQISAYISALHNRTGITISGGELIDADVACNLNDNIITSPDENYWLADYNEESCIMKVSGDSWDTDNGLSFSGALRPVITITKP